MTRKREITSITLAHINDTHSYFEPTSLQLTLDMNGQTLTPFVSAGGFARIATRIQQLRDDAERMKRGFVFVHAGDCFQGTLYFSLFKGKANADMLNALNIDAMALGNHELDMGNEPVAQFAKRIHFPLLAGNWDLSAERQNKAHRLSDNANVKAYDVARTGSPSRLMAVKWRYLVCRWIKWRILPTPIATLRLWTRSKPHATL